MILGTKIDNRGQYLPVNVTQITAKKGEAKQILQQMRYPKPQVKNKGYRLLNASKSIVYLFITFPHSFPLTFVFILIKTDFTVHP